jgi:hypothetical protein
MAGGIEVRGADQLAKMAKRFRAQGRAGIVREMVKEVRNEVKPIQAAQRREVSGLQHAPTEWKRYASKSARIRVTTGARSAGVRLTVAGKSQEAKQARRLNRGSWRHPLFGDRDSWFPQTVRPGWFDGPAKKGEPVVRARILQILDRYMRRLEGR